MSKVRIDVTREDIDAGEPGHPDSCAINLAASRAFPGVGCRTLRAQLVVGDSSHVADLPREAIDFIWRFDMRHWDLCVPFSFEIENPLVGS